MPLAFELFQFYKIYANGKSLNRGVFKFIVNRVLEQLEFIASVCKYGKIYKLTHTHINFYSLLVCSHGPWAIIIVTGCI